MDCVQNVYTILIKYLYNVYIHNLYELYTPSFLFSMLWQQMF